MVDRAKKISELPTVTSITNNDLFIVVTNTSGTAVTKQITINNFRAGLPPVVVGTANTSTLGTVKVGSHLSINATGHLSVDEDLSISNIHLTSTLDVTGTASFTSNVYLGVVEANAEQLIHVHGTIHSNVVPHTGGNYNLGNSTHYWLTLYVGAVGTQYVSFQDATLQNTAFTGSANVHWANVPANATASGVKNQIAYDTNYLYVCVANNVWKRAALTTWP